MNLALLIRKWCALHRDQTAVVLGEERRSYGELYERSCRLANGLTALGLRPQDRVAILGHNSIASLEQLTGLALGGFARVSLHTLNPVSMHRFMIEHVGARALIVTEELYPKVKGLAAEIESLEFVVVLGEGGEIGYETLLAGASPAFPDARIDPDDVLHLQFSSGTTGKPKAVIATHRAWIGETSENLLMLPPLDTTDRYLAAGPLTHAAMTVYFALMARGCSVVVMEKFDPAHAAELIERERCTFTMLVPTMIQLFVNHPEVRARDLSSLRVLLYAGSPITEQAIRDARALLGDVLYQTYGQSEGIPLTILTPADHARGIEGDRDLLRSAGRPTPNSLVKIIDDAGNELGPGEVGEIAMYTPGQMRGLWNNPSATAERFTPDGFVKTRDIGYLDANGYLYLADRKEDMIISGGFNIWPAEVENALASHPAVLEVSVFGVPHPKWGETPVAVVVLRDGAAATDTELIDWCRQEVGSLKKPTRVEFRSRSLPKSAVGKVLRRSLRDEFVASGPPAGTAS